MNGEQTIETEDVITEKLQNPFSRYKIIESIHSPLGLCVLALLIVSTFLAIVLTVGEFSVKLKFMGMLIGVLLFLIVFACVMLFVWFKPSHLTFDKNAHLIERKRTMQLSSKLPQKIYLRVDPGSCKQEDVLQAYNSLNDLQKLIGGPGIAIEEPELIEGNEEEYE